MASVNTNYGALLRSNSQPNHQKNSAKSNHRVNTGLCRIREGQRRRVRYR